MLNLLDLRGKGSDVAEHLPRPEIAGEGPLEVVRSIIGDVRDRGDEVLLELTSKFDGVDLDAVQVPDAELDRAVAELPSDVREAIDVAVANVRKFHEHQLRSEEVVRSPGMTIRAYQTPMERAGIYVPGGRAEYPSTVIMTVVPAKVAGVQDVILCVPPSKEHGGVSPTVLAAARLSGVSKVFAVGGAQAIAAMAYGTQSIAPVDVIAGPGNIYVAIAKQEVSGDVGVAAAFAGPSEIIVVADETAVPDFAAIDVMVQAEHGPDGLAWLVSWDEAVVEAVCNAGTALMAKSSRAEDISLTLAEGGYAALVDDREAALAVVNAIAPEHVELMVDDAEQMAAGVRNAGAIFCGNLGPASMGDYIAGPSHVLPTYGSARFSSALTVGDFLKDHHVVVIDQQGIDELGPHAIVLAETEGLTSHAESIRMRLSSTSAAADAGESA